MKNQKIKVLDNYPPYTPDFNAIEKMWKIIYYIAKCQPKNLVKFQEALEKSYDQINDEMIKNLILNVWNNYKICLDNKGF